MNLTKSAAVGLGSLAAAGLLAGCGAMKQASEVVVPNLIGKEGATARQLLTKRGLRWRWEESAKPGPSNGFLMADTIEGQTLAPGQHVKRGTVIVLVPSSDKIMVTSPLG
jgi:beta-lactam-binding protein with PASTA domain